LLQPGIEYIDTGEEKRGEDHTLSILESTEPHRDISKYKEMMCT
jgi:hypothetical protein